MKSYLRIFFSLLLLTFIFHGPIVRACDSLPTELDRGNEPERLEEGEEESDNMSSDEPMEEMPGRPSPDEPMEEIPEGTSLDEITEETSEIASPEDIQEDILEDALSEEILQETDPREEDMTPEEFLERYGDLLPQIAPLYAYPEWSTDLPGLLTLKKVDQDNIGTGLAGAVFRLYQYDPISEEYVESRRDLYVSGNRGFFNISNLLPNWAYMLVEVTPPDGYADVGYCLEFYIESQDIEGYPLILPPDYTGRALANKAAVVVTNPKDAGDVLLPECGGASGLICLYLGIVCILLTGLGAAKKPPRLYREGKRSEG